MQVSRTHRTGGCERDAGLVGQWACLRALGFTLIELLIVIVVVAVLAAIATPSMRDFIMNNRIVTQTNEFMTDMSYARTTAIERNTVVSLCKSDSLTACNTSGANWGIGWMVFVDQNGNGNLDGSDTVLRTHAALDGGNTLNADTNAPNFIRFDVSGTQVSSSSQATFALCDTRGTSQGRSIVVATVGKATISRSPTTCSP